MNSKRVLRFNDLPLIIGGVLVNTLVLMGVYYGEAILTVPFKTYFIKYLSLAVGVGLLWLIARYFYILLVRRYPGYQNLTKRRLGSIVLYIPFIIFFLLGTKFIRPLLNVKFDYFQEPTIGLELLVISLMFLVNSYLYDSFHLFSELKNLKIREARIQKEKVTAELLNLKSQISPHFLFNNLNTLLHLIATDNKKSQEFVHKLANIYKRTLELSDHDLISLRTEFEYIQAYTDLIKERFRNSVSFEITIRDNDWSKKLIPLSLQLTVENAIKHNVITKNNPLAIRITSQENFITIENNLQKKDSGIKTLGLGLKNLANRYRLVTNKKLVIDEKALHFSVKIPLLN